MLKNKTNEKKEKKNAAEKQNVEHNERNILTYIYKLKGNGEETSCEETNSKLVPPSTGQGHTNMKNLNWQKKGKKRGRQTKQSRE